MKEQIKHETIRLIYSIFFLVIVFAAFWLAYPKIAGKAGEMHAKGFWEAEKKAQDKRLYGGD